MNPSGPNPPAGPLPPPIPPLLPAQPSGPLGALTEEREPIPNVPAAIESLLRQPRRVLFHLRQPGSARLLLGLAFVGISSTLVYGLVMGTFSMGVQLWAAPLKAAGGLALSAIICLPSLYLFACLGGSRASLAEISGHLAGLVALMGLLLVGFAPVAWLFSQSTESVVWMGALHLLFWACAIGFGVRFLEQGFAQSQARSKAGLRVWLLLFVLVMLQMTTALRPLIGRSETFLPAEKKFFATHWGECLKEAGHRVD